MRVLDAVEHAARFAGVHGLRIDEFHVALGVREDLVGPGDGADLDRERHRRSARVIVAQEHQLAIDLGEAPAIGHLAVHAAFLEAENGAVGRVRVEDADVAGFVKMRDAALLVKPGVQFLGGGQLDELARHDEDQFAARLQVADAFFDEEQEEVAARVEQVRFQPIFRVDRNILKTHVGRVADDGVELLAQRVIEEIADLSLPAGAPGVDFDADTIGAALAQRAKKAPSPAEGSSARPLLRQRSSMKATTLGGVNTWPSCSRVMRPR
jgi:hypothetical protein